MIKTNFYTKVALAVLAQALPYAAFAQLAQPDTIYKQTFDDEASFMTMTLVDADKNGKQWDSRRMPNSRSFAAFRRTQT